MKNSISVLIDVTEKLLGRTAPEESEHYQEMVQMLYETQRINSNLIQLLTLYKLGNDIYPFSPEREEIAEFANLIASHVAPLISSKDIRLELDLQDDCYWEFDSDLISGVVVHAMNNAAHYTTDTIRLVIHEVDDVLEIRVEDNGRGFPQHMIDDGIAVMKGVDFSTGSTGLGLYFSAAVARMHRSYSAEGSICLENGGALGGGCFVMRLP
jgi:two-component system, OmpR family, sensor histidine kinase SenX3